MSVLVSAFVPPSSFPAVSIGLFSTDKWIKKMWYMRTMEYYSAMKMNKFESVVVRWMNL